MIVGSIRKVFVRKTDRQRRAVVVHMVRPDTRGVGLPKLLCVTYRHRIQPVRRNDVARERCARNGRAVGRRFGAPWIVNRSQTAVVVQRLGEISRSLQIGRECLDQSRRVRLLPAFIRDEVEELILQDGMAQRATVDVVAPKIHGAIYAILEGVSPGILALVKGRAMPLVGTRFQGETDCRTRTMTVL